MNATKHTPGTLNIAGETIHPRVVDRGKYGYAVEYPGGFVAAMPSKEVAQLTAAAPDLLGALEGALAQLTGPAQMYGDGIGNNGKKTGLSAEEFNALRDSRLEAARAAIAKATA
jgi:hypothetical protein